MITFKDSHYIGEGLIRTCYKHPDDKQLCIKVPKEHVTREYTNKEILYYLKLKKRKYKNFDYKFYSDYHGEIETEFGTGQVFDLVRDERTGEVSKTLEYYLQNDSRVSDEKLWSAVLKLKQLMTKHRVYTRDLRARNLCVKLFTDQRIEIVIIDGIGHRDFFPLAD